MMKIDYKRIGTKVIGLGIGAWGANAGVKFLPASIDNKLQAGIQIAAGALIPALIGKKSPMLESVGDGMIAIGAVNLISDLTAPKTVTGIYGNMQDYSSHLAGNEMDERF